MAIDSHRCGVELNRYGGYSSISQTTDLSWAGRGSAEQRGSSWSGEERFLFCNTTSKVRQMWALRPDCVVDRPGRSMSGGEKLTARPLHLNDKVGQPSRESESADRAMVCGPAPVGQARWSVRLIATEAVRRKLVPQVGRETIRMLLESHDLKPWREKHVVRGTAG